MFFMIMQYFYVTIVIFIFTSVNMQCLQIISHLLTFRTLILIFLIIHFSFYMLTLIIDK